MTETFREGDKIIAAAGFDAKATLGLRSNGIAGMQIVPSPRRDWTGKFIAEQVEKARAETIGRAMAMGVTDPAKIREYSLAAGDAVFEHLTGRKPRARG